MLELSLHPSLGRLLQLSLIFVTAVHFVASVAFFILQSDANNFDVWFQNPDLPNQPLYQQYAVTWDWASKNLVGMSRGSSFPPNEVAMVFVVFVTFFGVCIYGLLMANLSMYYERVTPQSDLLQTIDTVIDTREYMGMQEEFSEAIIEYYTHVMKARHHLTEADEIFDSLPEELDDELTEVVGRELIEQIPVLAGQAGNRDFVLLFARILVPIVLLPNSVVFRKDDFGVTMYFVVNGAVSVLDPLDESKVLVVLGQGAMIGEIAILTDLPRTATVVTGDRFVDCLSLDKHSFQQMIDQFPDAMGDIQAKVEKRAAALQKRKVEKEMGDAAAATAKHNAMLDAARAAADSVAGGAESTEAQSGEIADAVD